MLADEVRSVIASFGAPSIGAAGAHVGFSGAPRIASGTFHPANAGVALGVWRTGGGAYDHSVAARVTQQGPAAIAILTALRARYPVDEMYVGRLVGPRPVPVAANATQLMRKQAVLIPGLSVGHPGVTAGTLGAFVNRPQDPQIYILSNNHVLANVNTVATAGRSQAGNPTLQPGPMDRGALPQDRIGQLFAFHQMQMFGETMDAAISVLDGGLSYNAVHDNARIAGFASVQQGQRVWKVGRTTGRTWGTVGSTDVLYANVFYDGAQVRVSFDHQIEVFGDGMEFSQGGDSGSVVLDEANNAVGLLFAGTPAAEAPPYGYTLMHPIEPVLARFGITFV